MDRFSQIKSAKFFKWWDFVLYTSAVLIVTVLFVFMFAFSTPLQDNGIAVILNGKTAFTFDFSKQTHTVLAGLEDNFYIEHNLDGSITVIVFTGENFTGKNVININPAEKTAKVTESNCSVKKDCVHTPAVSNGTGAIICMPHNIRIVPLGNNYIPIVTG